MAGELEGAVAFVTGATRGIGLATAKALGKAGARIVISDIFPEEDEATRKALSELRSENIRCDFFQCDVRKYEEVERTISEIERNIGPISVLVNNAGIPQATKPLWETTLEEWENVIRTNLDSVFYCMKLVLPKMIERNYGRIVTLSSISGKEGNAREAAYSATKHGVLGLTKSVAKEVLNYNIRINAVCPALINTPLLESLPQSQIDYFTNKIPLGRLGKAEEVADLIKFLVCSEAVNFITGMAFDISGGRADY